MAAERIIELLSQESLHPIVDFDHTKDKFAKLNLSKVNKKFTSRVFNDMGLFSDFINQIHVMTEAKYLIGGYRELRQMYSRSELFDLAEEPRTLHLGIDIWGHAGTKVYSPLNGKIHSFHFNAAHGDYGATIIVEHHLEETHFHLLYGHLSSKDLLGLEQGKNIKKGDLIGHFGPPPENGNWPPHLHFQLIRDMGNWQGDFPGVCQPSQAATFLSNCPDPSVFLKYLGYE